MRDLMYCVCVGYYNCTDHLYLTGVGGWGVLQGEGALITTSGISSLIFPSYPALM